jgi:hypothetical protein
LNIKFPFLLSVWNKLLILISLALIMMIISIGPGLFSYSYQVRLLILGAILFVFGFIGGYKSWPLNSDVRNRNGWVPLTIHISFVVLISVNTVHWCFSSNHLEVSDIRFIFVLISSFPLFTLLYIGERLGRCLFVRHYPDLAYVTEEPDNKPGCSMENKQL